jgi:hypothetical protein
MVIGFGFLFCEQFVDKGYDYGTGSWGCVRFPALQVGRNPDIVSKVVQV